MKFSDAIVVYIRDHVIPNVAGDSEFTAALLSGALNSGKKRFAASLGKMDLLKKFGFVDQNGNADPEMVKDFVEGFFENREKVCVSLAEIVKFITGVDSSSPLLDGRIAFTRDDSNAFLDLLKK